MSKIFDYKFLIILGLSLVVYFLYREVDFLNKRVAKLETNTLAIASVNPQMIDLPPPPSDEDETISSTIEEINTNETFDKSPSHSSRSSSKRTSSKRSSPKSSPKRSSPKSPTKTTIDNIIDY